MYDQFISLCLNGCMLLWELKWHTNKQNHTNKHRFKRVYDHDDRTEVTICIILLGVEMEHDHTNSSS